MIPHHFLYRHCEEAQRADEAINNVIPAKAGIQIVDPRHFRRRTSSSSRKVLRALARALKHSGMTLRVRLLRHRLQCRLAMTESYLSLAESGGG